MDLSNLKPAEGSVKNKKRIGRGQGSGRGGTATKGHKGAQSRSGYKRKLGFEGGQMPLYRRVPKFGFKIINRKEFRGINLSVLQELADKLNIVSVNKDILIENGLAGKNDLIKILGNGSLTTKIEVTANGFTKTAQAAIEAQGGTVIKI